jgi:hypothetical protein
MGSGAGDDIPAESGAAVKDEAASASASASAPLEEDNDIDDAADGLGVSGSESRSEGEGAGAGAGSEPMAGPESTDERAGEQRLVNGRPFVRLKVRPITDSDRALVEGWRANGMLYEAPRGICDDWFLLVASLATTTDVCAAPHRTAHASMTQSALHDASAWVRRALKRC